MLKELLKGKKGFIIQGSVAAVLAVVCFVIFLIGQNLILLIAALAMAGFAGWWFYCASKS